MYNVLDESFIMFNKYEKMSKLSFSISILGKHAMRKMAGADSDCCKLTEQIQTAVSSLKVTFNYKLHSHKIHCEAGTVLEKMYFQGGIPRSKYNWKENGKVDVIVWPAQLARARAAQPHTQLQYSIVTNKWCPPPLVNAREVNTAGTDSLPIHIKQQRYSC